ncbi:FAD-dependent oxidoreductase [Curvibacter sp. HBC28]|uniref:FAD-dependent oxidoreductase n=1 Tax=Curvibacter microcysteis TaxID=3026419 RepID=A0ABT5MD48_9BURK|nr:FAD-dependent oxidoreductase [Curvibacter sp. HBC28]MDD0814509.1 FAD-dependent oxidoreductase [Curvibacter sp. HBC28]
MIGPHTRRVAVLGAGLMGRLMAWRLARAGQTVALYEAGSPQAEGAAARVAAAMLAPLAESAVTELPVVRMGQYALGRWPALLAELREPVFFQREGTLIVWHRQDRPEAQRFEHLLRNTTRHLPELPVPQALDAAGLAGLEPELADRFSQGLYLPDEGQLDNRALLAALLSELQSCGVALHWNSPQEPATLAADASCCVLDCRGIGANPQWTGLRAVRGEVARLHAPGVQLSRPTRLIHPRYPIYIAPKPDQVFVIGATEIESEDFSPVSVRSTLELLSAAYTVHPGFGEARILELSSQCRPTLPDNLPALRQLAPNLLQINGLYRHGFLIAPAIADVACAWLTQGDDTLAQRLGVPLSTVLPA